MKILLIFVLSGLLGCNGSKKGTSSIGNKVDVDLSGKQAADSFIKSSALEIDPSLKITPNDLDQWLSEGLITESEAQSLREKL